MKGLLLRQAQLAHDRLDVLALGAQRLHRRVAFPGPPDQGAFFRVPGGGNGRGLFQVRCRIRLRHGRCRRDRLVLKAGTVMRYPVRRSHVAGAGGSVSAAMHAVSRRRI
jgi:hypothetical protein